MFELASAGGSAASRDGPNSRARRSTGPAASTSAGGRRPPRRRARAGGRRCRRDERAARSASRRSAAFCRSSASSAMSAISDQASSAVLSSCRLRRSAARALAYWPASISALACCRCVCASCFSASISVARALSLAGLMRRTCLMSATCSSGDSASAARRSQVTSWVGSSRTISAKCCRAPPMFLSRTAAMPCSVSWLITCTRARPARVLARVSVGLSAQARSRYASRSIGSPARAAQASHTSGDDGA